MILEQFSLSLFFNPTNEEEEKEITFVQVDIVSTRSRYLVNDGRQRKRGRETIY